MLFCLLITITVNFEVSDPADVRLLISYLQGCDKWVPIETKDLTISRVSRFGQAMFTHDRLVFPLSIVLI